MVNKKITMQVFPCLLYGCSSLHSGQTRACSDAELAGYRSANLQQMQRESMSMSPLFLSHITEHAFERWREQSKSHCTHTILVWCDEWYKQIQMNGRDEVMIGLWWCRPAGSCCCWRSKQKPQADREMMRWVMMVRCQRQKALSRSQLYIYIYTHTLQKY